jgi:UDP-N-acetylglucosamine--N-acetylmuramyl-(pentapeptide) pyrophosphoryl-undecaprenol N-acetylglucosamine transferase
VTGTLILAGGGTGGHVFPLLAVADALRELDPQLRLLFVGTARGMEKRLVPERGYALELLPVLPLRGAGPVGALRALFRAAELVPSSVHLLRQTRARGVLSIGGYAAVPMTLAAVSQGLPLGVIEPNSVPGLANVLAAPFADRAYLAFEEAEMRFSPAQVRMLGVPIRRGFSLAPFSKRPGERLRILVLGGSQGSKALNESVPRAMGLISGQIDIRHQAGAGHAAEVTAQYESVLSGKSSDLTFDVTPFIEDMQGALAWAHVVVGRAGASAVSELLAVGRPSILVPYPFASGDHQRLNALAVERGKAGICIESRAATPPRIAREIQDLITDEARLGRMAQAAARLGRSQAAVAIANDFLSLLKGA